MLKKVLFWGCLLFALTSSTAFSQELCNIALGRPYVMSSPPNYKKCIDSGDTFQLTDGEKKGSLWKSLSTVGWAKKADRVKIEVTVTIDLGSERKFEEVKVFGRCNAWDIGVDHIEIFASNDGEEFEKIGVLRGIWETEVLEYEYIGYAETYSISIPGAKGRYVRIMIRGKKHFVFCDEIEVLSAP